MHKRSARNNNGTVVSSIPREAAEDLGLVDDDGRVPATTELDDVIFHHDRETGEWTIDVDRDGGR